MLRLEDRENGSFYERCEPAKLPDVGSWGASEVSYLIEWIIKDSGDSGEGGQELVVEHRLAPSIVTRGEAQMLGLSDPRFARRVRVRKPHPLSGRDEVLALINLRRLSRLHDQIRFRGRVKTRRGMLAPLLGKYGPSFSFAWQEELRKASSVADCVVTLPKRMRTAPWSVLTMPEEVLRQYGEGLNGRAVPFMKHVKFLGGGMCAQACCFMANIICGKTARQIYACPEITAVSSPDDLDRVKGGDCEISGMTARDIARYFEAVGLRAINQRHRQTEVSNAKDLALLGTFMEPIVEAYIASGWPIIFLVDLGRMKGVGTYNLPGTDILSENGVNVRKTRLVAKTPKHACHAVVGIGVDVSGLKRVVINDPAHLPYICTPTKKLIQAGTYQSDPDDSSPVLSGPQFIAVTPKNVRLPLLSHHRCDIPGETGVQEIPGLDMLSRAFALEMLKEKDAVLRSIFKMERVAFRLVDISQPWDPSFVFGMSVAMRKVTVALMTEIRHELPASHRWVWLEIREGCVLLWDAEFDIVRKPNVGWRGPLILVSDGQRRYAEFGQLSEFPWGRDERTHGTVTEVKAPQRETISTEMSRCRRLQPSVISSFSASGLSTALARWPERATACDCYAFMLSDEDILPSISLGLMSRIYGGLMFAAFRTRDWLSQHLPRMDRYAKFTFKPEEPKTPHPIGRPQTNVCQWLADNSGNRGYLDRVARNLLHVLADKAMPCRSFTTFIPEVTGDRSTARSGRNALVSILRVIARLNDKSFRERELKRSPDKMKQMADWWENIAVLEVVAGTLIDFIEFCPRRGDHEKSCRVHQMSMEDALRRVRESITTLEDDIMKAGVRLAFELEPGPLNVLSSAEDIVALAAVVPDSLRERICFNLDIAHWELAGVTAEAALSSADFPHSRIIQAHLSGFSKGHLGDFVPDQDHRKAFERWLAYLRIQHYQAEHAEPINVSLELEATCSQKMVQNGVNALLDACRHQPGCPLCH